MGRPSYAIASTSRITDTDLINYIVTMAKAGRHRDIYMMEPNAIRNWLNSVNPYNAKIIARNGKHVIESGDIYSTPREMRAGETQTTATPEEIRNSYLSMLIRKYKLVKAKTVTVDSSNISLDVYKTEDKVAIAVAEKAKADAILADLSEKDKVIVYREPVRQVNTTGAKLAAALDGLGNGSITLEAFNKAINNIANKGNGKPVKAKSKGRGTISIIGNWGK